MNITYENQKKPEKIVDIQGLTRSFGKRKALDDLDLSIYRGEVFGFLGPNGAGKSTLMRIMAGLLTPDKGKVNVLGYTMPEEADKLRSRLGYMTQKFSLYIDLSVDENLDFAAEIFGLEKKKRKQRIEKILKEYELFDRRSQRPATMSGGWRQRLALAVATIHEPELLFLDEPTAGVDPENRRMFWEKLFDLAAEGKTILVSTHYMDEAVRCHRLCLLREGELGALGSPDHLMEELRGRILEINARPPEKVLNFLMKNKEVASATQMGNLLHVLLKNNNISSDRIAILIKKELKKEGFKVQNVESAEPNLEDVFVALTQGEAIKTSSKSLSSDKNN